MCHAFYTATEDPFRLHVPDTGRGPSTAKHPGTVKLPDNFSALHSIAAGEGNNTHIQQVTQPESNEGRVPLYTCART